MSNTPSPTEVSEVAEESPTLAPTDEPPTAPTETAIPAPTNPPAADGVLFPGAEWARDEPQNHGITPSQLTALEEERAANYGLVSGIVVIKDGYLVYESYHGIQEADTLMEIYSVTKSVTSLLTGLALGDGSLPNLADPVSAYLPSYFDAIDNADTQSITIENLLTHTTGLRSGWQLEGVPINGYRGDLFEQALDLGQTSPPGTVSQYSTLVANLMSGVLQNATGEDLELYAADNLFAPLGIDTWQWYRDDSGIPTTTAGLLLTTSDMARLGYLVLNEGRWGDEQIISAEYIKESTNKQYETLLWTEETHDYGYFWWLPSSLGQPGYLANGYGGQFIYVIPNENMVVAISSRCCTDPTSGWNARLLVEDFLVNWEE